MNKTIFPRLFFCGVLPTLLGACTESNTETFDILFEGDSDIEGWNTEGYKNSINLGLGGATCQDVLDELDDTLAAYTTNNVVLVCGENDFPDQSASDTFSLFKNIVEKIQETGATVIYMGTKPEPETIELHQQYRVYDELIKQHAISLASGALAPLVMIDVYNGFEDLENPNSLYAEDQLHLSAEGYAYWDEWLRIALLDETCAVWKSGSCTNTDEN